jgi:hypothetical protein
MNLFNRPPPAPQETRNLYYEAGAARSSKAFSRAGPESAPYVESFEELMARVRKEPESPAAGHGGAPDAEVAERAGGAGEFGGIGDQTSSAEKRSVAEKRSETEGPDEQERSGEDVLAGEMYSGMAAVRPDGDAGENALEKAVDDAAMPASLDVDLSLSAEDGITLTDTYPLFDNKPDVMSVGFDTPVAGLEQDAAVTPVNATISGGLNGEADAVKKSRGAKGGQGGVSGEALEPQVPQESDYRLASFVDEAELENAAGEKKADPRRFNVTVVDMRSDAGANVQGGAASEGGEAESSTMPVKDITVDLKGALPETLWNTPGDNRHIQAGFERFDDAGAKSAARLESFLSRELHNGLNGDIVRQAAVMLRDGGEGLIRLQLHPESLGNVRIKLAMSGNRVEGIITVESPEAMNAFERELESLEMAFRDSGFEGASLNMQMSGGKTGGDLFDGVREGTFSQVIAASSYESTTVTAGEIDRSIYDHGGLSIFA